MAVFKLVSGLRILVFPLIFDLSNHLCNCSLLFLKAKKILYTKFVVGQISTYVVQSLRIRMLCEAYKVGWDFVIAPEQQQPHPNLQLCPLAKTLLVIIVITVIAE